MGSKVTCSNCGWAEAAQIVHILCSPDSHKHKQSSSSFMIKNKSVSAARSCECVLYSILLTSVLMVNIISGSASHTFLMTNDHLPVGSFMDAAYHAIKCSLCRLLFKHLLVSCNVTSAAVISGCQWGCRPHAEFLIWSFVGCYFIIVDTMNHFRISGTPYEVNVEKMKDMHIYVSHLSV